MRNNGLFQTTQLLFIALVFPAHGRRGNLVFGGENAHRGRGSDTRRQRLKRDAAGTDVVCRLQADVCFVIDSSTSISPSNWNLLLSFVSDVIGAFHVGADATRVGVVLFSSDASLVIPMDRYHSTRDLQRHVTSLEHVRGLTNTGKALYVTRTECFSPFNGEREGAPNIAIVLTDGLPTITREYSASQEAAQLHQMATVLAVGISGFVEDEFLKEISSWPQLENENFFSSPNFSDLQSILNVLVTQTCEAPLRATTRAPPAATPPAGRARQAAKITQCLQRVRGGMK